MINQKMTDEHFDAPSLDACQTCGMTFPSDDGAINADYEECATCAQLRIDNDMLAQEFADSVCHAMGRDYEQDDLRAMFDEGMSVEAACADLASARIDREIDTARRVSEMRESWGKLR